MDAFLALAVGSVLAVLAVRLRRERLYRDILTRVRVFGKECLEAIAKESEQRARVAVVRWGVAGVLGVGAMVSSTVVVVEYREVIGPLVAHAVGVSVTRPDDIASEAGASYDPPAKPTLSYIVSDTSTVRLLGPSFSGDGDDTHASSDWVVTRYGQTDTLISELASDSLEQITIMSNANFKADSVYSAFLTYNGTNGGASTASDTVAFTMIEAAALVHFCDWDYATGNSDAAVLGQANGNDGSSGFGECFDEWTANIGDLLTVVAVPTLPTVSGASQSWPDGMTNVLRVEWEDFNGDSTKMVQCDSCWVPPAIGEYQFWRLYEYRECIVGEACGGHWLHGGNNNAGGTSEYAGVVYKGVSNIATDSTYTLQVNPGETCNSCGGPGGGVFATNDTIKSFRLYRIEFRWHRVSSTTFRIAFRMYNGTSGALIVDESDFLCEGGSGKCMVAGYRNTALGDSLTTYSRIDMWHSAEIGNNGSYPINSTPHYQYIGGWAVRVSSDSTAWIGAYPVAGSGEGN